MSFIYLAFDKTPHISLHSKLLPVQYRECTYGLLFCTETNTKTLVYETVFSCTFEDRGAIEITNHSADKTEKVLKPLTATVGFLKIQRSINYQSLYSGLSDLKISQHFHLSHRNGSFLVHLGTLAYKRRKLAAESKNQQLNVGFFFFVIHKVGIFRKQLLWWTSHVAIQEDLGGQSLRSC